MICKQHLAWPAALGILALGACDKPAEPAPAPPAAATPAVPTADAPPPALQGFRHDSAVDATGYYMPTAPAQVGNYKLTNISIGPPEEFAKWERGERMATYAPVMIELEDVTSPVKTNELGQDYHTVRARILPSAYSVEKTVLRFAGRDPELGDISFEGTIDPVALGKAQAQQEAGVVIRGDLLIGQSRLNGQGFSYFAGD